MEDNFFDFIGFFSNPSVAETFVDILLCAVPIWLAVMIGLVIGWSWRPRWTGLVFLGFRSKLRFLWTVPPGLGARRIWLAFTALSAFSVAFRTLLSRFTVKGKESPTPINGMGDEPAVSGNGSGDITSSGGSSQIEDLVTENDRKHLLHLLESGELGWQSMMERSTSNLTYQAWRHEPEVGPVVYRSRTVFEDATPEIVRDFFWDDEFRPKWDPMLAYFKILEECPHTGTMVVHWIKKFPFFCSDREYIIGRRIWEAGKTFYCVTKAGVPYPALPRRDKPRRVDLYFSSWVIKPVQSRRGDGQMSACEVSLVHHEDMGIPKDVAKLGVRHGMWGTVKKMHSGLRAYQQERDSDAPLSKFALLAGITAKISSEDNTNLSSLGGRDSVEEDKDKALNIQGNGDRRGIDWKLLAVGGGVALVLGLHSGLIGKAVLLGAGRRLARRR